VFRKNPLLVTGDYLGLIFYFDEIATSASNFARAARHGRKWGVLMVSFANVPESLYSRDWIFPIGVMSYDVKMRLSYDAFLAPFVRELKALAVRNGMLC